MPIRSVSCKFTSNTFDAAAIACCPPETTDVSAAGEALLNAGVSARFHWKRFALKEGDAWIFAALPKAVPADIVVVLSSYVSIIALSMRSSIAHEALAAAASTDSLTKLANRASFVAALAASLSHPLAQPTCVLFIDLDDFKQVNDAHGHHRGDELLRAIADILRRSTRPNDLCARFGGDEFAVLLENASIAEAEEISQRIISAVSLPIFLGDRPVYVGASIGVAVAAPDVTIGDLMQRADAAMYAAKARGKGRVEMFDLTAGARP